MIDRCRCCGGEIIETPFGWFCERSGDQEPHFVLYKDSLKKYGGVLLDETDARALNAGGTITAQLKSRKTGRWYTARIGYDWDKRTIRLLFDRW